MTSKPCKVLLDSGADPRLAMANGSNVLTLLAGIRPASGSNSADQIVASLRLLTERGANPNARTTRGETPLLVAARLGSNTVVRALVELGADLNATDNTGKTALDTVKEPGRNRHQDTEALFCANWLTTPRVVDRPSPLLHVVQGSLVFKADFVD